MIVPPARVAVALVAAVTLVGCGSAAQAGATVPNVVGKALDAAKTTLQSAGFAAASQDLLRGRNPLLDSSWTVCTQTPGPVLATQGTTVDLGVVKKAETCPEQAATAAPTATSTAAPRTTVAAPTRTPAVAVGNPKPRPAAPKPQPQPTPTPAAAASDAGGSGPTIGTVTSGVYCDPPGSGVSRTGKPMVCARAADGRNRWQSA